MSEKIRWISPYSLSKNIGGEINETISELPDNCWVGLTDHDMMFLRPDSKRQIHEVISSKHGNDLQVFGCLTNRLSSRHQLFMGACNMIDFDIKNHALVADFCHDKNYGVIEETTANIAAMMMVFRKSTWEKVGGFDENRLDFDNRFTNKVMKQGGKLGIMQGVYVFHAYRLNSKDPANDVKHLIK